MTPLRAVSYTRVSTRDKGQDTENQAVQIRQFAASQGWILIDEYCDHVSAKNSDRDEFRRMFQDASQRKFDVVLFWSLDRFSREGVRETLNHLERLSSYGIGYRSFTEQYLDSCGVFKDAVLSILATIAKQERIRISERTLAGLDTARRNGKTLGRPRAVFDRTRMHEMRAAGMSLGAIARALGSTKSVIAREVSK